MHHDVVTVVLDGTMERRGFASGPSGVTPCCFKRDTVWKMVHLEDYQARLNSYRWVDQTKGDKKRGNGIHGNLTII